MRATGVFSHVWPSTMATISRRAIACKACETIQRMYRGYLARLVAEFLRVLVRRVIAAQVRCLGGFVVVVHPSREEPCHLFTPDPGRMNGVC